MFDRLPKYYVPIQVPIYDEPETLRRNNELRYSSDDDLTEQRRIEAVYRWPYRSEMQFTVFDLALHEINREKEYVYINPETLELERITLTENVYQEGEQYVGCEDYESLLDCMLHGADAVEVLYDLQGPDNAPLDPFGPPRELIFSEGAEEVLATQGADQTVRFEHHDHLASLDSSAFLGIALFQNNDSANVLWEFAYVRSDDCGDGCDPDAINPMVGNPVNAYTGNNYERETDYAGPQDLRFTRYYNSLEQIDTEPTLGPG